MSNEIVKAGPTNIIRTMDDAERAARAMSASGFFSDAKQASQAIVKILAGQELGFGPFASMTGVNIIQNRPTLAANLMAAAVKRTNKYNYRVTQQTDNVCELTWFENGQEVGRSSFTIEEAQRAGLANKDNWKKYPSDMLFARAISRGQRRYAPDVFNGATVYTPDEMGATVDEEGNVIEVKAEPVTTSPADPEAAYNAAKQVLVKTSKGDKFVGEMTLEELQKVIEKSIIPASVEAARVVMVHDFQMEPETEGQSILEG